MKTIRRFSLVFSAIFFLTFAVNTFDSFAFEPGWIYGNYEAVVAGYDFSLEIGFESGTDLDCMYFTGYHTDVYEQFYTCDNVVFHGTIKSPCIARADLRSSSTKQPTPATTQINQNTTKEGGSS